MDVFFLKFSILNVILKIIYLICFIYFFHIIFTYRHLINQIQYNCGKYGTFQQEKAKKYKTVA